MADEETLLKALKTIRTTRAQEKKKIYQKKFMRERYRKIKPPTMREKIKLLEEENERLKKKICQYEDTIRPLVQMFQ